MRLISVILAVAFVSGCAASAPRAAVPDASPAAPSAATAHPRPTPSTFPVPPVVDASVDALTQGLAPAPTRLTIAGIDLDMAIEPVGLAPDASMEIPAAASVAGWYEHGRAPAHEQGNTVVAAHVDDGSIGLGPFADLRRLEQGSPIEVVDASGAVHSYVVTSVEQTAKTTVDPDLLFSRDGQPQLVLVTCGGRWDESTSHYDDNVIVWAEPLQVAS